MAPLLQHAGFDSGFAGFPDPSRFSPELGESQLRAAARQSNDDPAPRLLSLHLHLPADDAFGTPAIAGGDRARVRACFNRLARECEIVAPLFDRDRDVVHLQVDGGPGALDGEALGELLHGVSRHFFLSRSNAREFLIELPPGLRDAGELGDLVDMGFNRVRFTSLRHPGAAEPADEALVGRCLADAREAGFRSAGLDFVYGWPGCDDATLDARLENLLALRPDRVALQRAPRNHDAGDDSPGQGPAAQRAIAIRALLAAGYDAMGLDLFSLPHDDLARARRRGQLHYGALGYVPHPETDLIGLGAGARSRIGDAWFQNYAELTAWESAIDMGDLPVWRGLTLDADGRLRSEVLQALLCTGAVDIPHLEELHGIVFEDYFQAEIAVLQPLLDAGLAQLGTRELQLGLQGRLALRAVCSPFGLPARRP